MKLSEMIAGLTAAAADGDIEVKLLDRNWMIEDVSVGFVCEFHPDDHDGGNAFDDMQEGQKYVGLHIV